MADSDSVDSKEELKADISVDNIFRAAIFCIIRSTKITKNDCVAI